MKFFRRQAPPKPEPTPFNAWAPPPLGSLGTEWDTRMDFPRDLAEDRRQEEARQQQEAKQRKRQLGEINKGTMAIKKAWHPWAIAAGCALVCALSSTGPATFLRLPLGILTIGASLIAIYRIRNVNVFHRGVGFSVAAVTLAVGIVALEAVRLAGIKILFQ